MDEPEDSQQSGAMVELYRPLNEVEGREIASLLRESGIAHHLVCLTDTPYPSIGMKPPEWGKIMVDPGQVQKAEALIEAYIGSEPEAIGDAWKKPAQAPQPKVIGSLGINQNAVLWAVLLASLAYNIVQWAQLQASTSLTDSQGRLVAEFEYDLGATYPTEAHSYDTREQRVATSYDRNDDGRVEHWVELREGRPVFRGWDQDENGRYERTRFYADGKAVFETRDPDEDGVVELAGVPDDHGELGPPLFRDDDDDHIAETVECKRGHETVVFDVVACAVKP